MKYTSSKVEYLQSTKRLVKTNHAINGMTAPFDIKTGGENQVWFTASDNFVGRLNADRSVTPFHRLTGKAARLFGQDDLSVAKFIIVDPEGDCIGRICADGAFLADIDLGKGSRPISVSIPSTGPTVIGSGGKAQVYVRTNAGKPTVLDCKAPGISAVSYAGGWIWYIAGGTIYYFEYDGPLNGSCKLPPGAEVHELVTDDSIGKMFYCDTKRDVIGRIYYSGPEDEFRVHEYFLPKGVAPRTVSPAPYAPRSTWFIARDGKALCLLFADKVTEFMCADESADLTRMAWEAEDVLWFSESGANRVSHANVNAI